MLTINNSDFVFVTINLFKKLKFETDYENTLAKQIDKSKWNDNELTHICFRDVDETSHPTEYGHKKIARSLMMDFMSQL